MRIATISSLLITAVATSAFAATSSKKAPTVRRTTTTTVVETTAPRTSSAFRLARVTPKVGLLSSNFDGDVALNDSRNALQVGALAEMTTPVSGLAAESGLVYEQLGGASKYDLPGETVESGVRLNYLKVPLYAKYYLPMTTATKVFVKAGPSVGYMVSKTEFTSSKDNNSEREIKDEDVNRFQVAAELGAGLLIPAGGNNFVIDWTFTRGLTNVFGRGNQTAYNSAFGLSAGMSFDL